MEVDEESIEVDIEIEENEENESEPVRLRNPTEGNPTIAEFYRRLGVM